MRILIIRLGAIGDVVHSTIIVDMIKKKFDGSTVDFLTSASIAPLLSCKKTIDNVFAFDIAKKNDLFYLLKCAIDLRKNGYDVVFPLTNSLRTLFLTYFISPQKVIKRYNKKSGVEGFYRTGLLLSPDLERVDRLNLDISAEEKDKVAKYVENNGNPVVVFAPCGMNDAKRPGRIWRDTNWLKLA